MANYDHSTDKSKGLFDSVGIEMPQAQIAKGINLIIGHPAGKWYLSNRIIKMIPDHKTYVEPFCGSASVFFSKEPSEKEVLADINSDWTFILKFVRDMKPTQRDALKGYNWTPAKSRVKEFIKDIHKGNYDNDTRRFYKTIYAYKHSFNSMLEGGYSSAAAPVNKSRIDYWYDTNKPRLEGVKVITKPAKKVIKEYDSDDTFFYLDPPYIGGEWHGDYGKGEDTFDLDKFISQLKKVDGKFICSYSSDMKDKFKSFKTKSIKVQQVSTKDRGKSTRKEIIVSNFSVVSKDTEKQVKDEKLDEGEGELTRQEQRELLEEELGNYYMVEQPEDKVFPWVLQYHLRGIWSSEYAERLKSWFKSLRKGNIPEDINETVSKRLKLYKSRLRKIDTFYENLTKTEELTGVDGEPVTVESGLVALSKRHKQARADVQKVVDRCKLIKKATEENDTETVYKQVWKDNDCERLDSTLKNLSAELQEVDDERGDVTRALDKHLDEKPSKLSELDLSIVYNRGNVHGDLRNEEPEGRYLVSWTNNTVKVVLQSLDDKLYYPLRDRILENKEGDQWLSEKKAPQGIAWRKLVTPDKPMYEAEPEQVGATSETSGRFYLMAKGKMAYGIMKSDYHELFYRFDNVYKRANREPKPADTLNGRWDYKLIPSRKEYTKAPEDEFWMGSRPWATQTPYILTHDKEEEEKKAKEDEIEMIWNETILSALKKLGLQSLIEKRVNLFKVDKERQVIKGPALVPMEKDKQGDTVTKQEVENAFYKFAKRDPKLVSIEHDEDTYHRDNKIVELWLTEQPRDWNGIKLPSKTMMVGIFMGNSNDWKRVKEGELKGFSIGGGGVRYVRT